MPKPEPRIFAIGDIHGHADALDALLARLSPDPDQDALIFLGDYINRGPDSRRVLDRLVALEHEMADTVFLEGNHEWALLDYALTGDLDSLRLLRTMDVEATLASYGDSPVRSLRDLSFLPPEHRDFLERLHPFHRRGGYLFVHAGVVPGQAAEDSSPDKLQTARSLFLSSPAEEGETVVFGHTSLATPLVAPGRIGIDTGCGKGNLLTALELPARIFHHA